MTIEDKLIEGLIESYKAKGINLQRILDNPLFQSLPLDKKVRIIESEAIKFPAPKMDYKPILEGAGIGAISTMTGLAMASATGAGSRTIAQISEALAKGGLRSISPSLPVIGIAAAVGAILGSTLPAWTTYQNHQRDKQTYRNTGSGLKSLIGRSMSSHTPVPPSFNLHEIIHGLDDKSVDVLHTLDNIKI